MLVKFLVDFMLGKLAKELRILGFDTQYVNSSNLPNKNPLVLLNIAKEEDRILLTRNTKLKDNPSVVFITSEKVSDQIEQVVDRFKLSKVINPFSRCIICNGVLVSTTKEQVRNKVPFYIFQTKEKFAYCHKCQKIYWEGTHLKDMKKRVRKLSSSD
jgi:uncharacterized protein with PIN domain